MKGLLIEGFMDYFHDGVFSDKWVSRYLRFYDDGILEMFEDKQDKKADLRVNMLDVCDYLCVGHYTKNVPGKPKLPSHSDPALVICFPRDTKRKEDEIVWLMCSSMDQLNDWMKLFVSTYAGGKRDVVKERERERSRERRDRDHSRERNRPDSGRRERPLGGARGLPLNTQPSGFNSQGVPQQPIVVPNQNPTMNGWGFNNNPNMPTLGFGSGWVNTPGYDKSKFEAPPINIVINSTNQNPPNQQNYSNMIQNPQFPQGVPFNMNQNQQFHSGTPFNMNGNQPLPPGAPFNMNPNQMGHSFNMQNNFPRPNMVPPGISSQPQHLLNMNSQFHQENHHFMPDIHRPDLEVQHHMNHPQHPSMPPIQEPHHWPNVEAHQHPNNPFNLPINNMVNPNNNQNMNYQDNMNNGLNNIDNNYNYQNPYDNHNGNIEQNEINSNGNIGYTDNTNIVNMNNFDRPNSSNHNNFNNNMNSFDQHNDNYSQNRPGSNSGAHNRPGSNSGAHNRPGSNSGAHNRPGSNSGSHNRPGSNSGAHNTPVSTKDKGKRSK